MRRVRSCLPPLTDEERRKRKRKKLRHWRQLYPERSLLRQAQKRAHAKGKKFTITLKDIVIPERCPVLGTRLTRGTRLIKDGTPSVDEIIPGKGYTPKNICVISWRANRLKSDATLTELRKVLAYYEERTACP